MSRKASVTVTVNSLPADLTRLDLVQFVTDAIAERARRVRETPSENGASVTVRIAQRVEEKGFRAYPPA
jgi:hypothetical protein